MAAPAIANDRVLLPTRIVSAVIAPFLIAAFVVLFPWPGDTKQWFAWQIKPTLSPMVLGSVYLGGALLHDALRCLRVFFRNRGEYAGDSGDELRISTIAAAGLVVGGAAALAMSAFLFLFPYRAIDAWPWTLSPLPSRGLGPSSIRATP